MAKKQAEIRRKKNTIRKDDKKPKNAVPKLKSALKSRKTRSIPVLDLSTNVNGKLELLFQTVEEAKR